MKIKNILHKLRFIANKYFLTITFLLVWLTFFDRYDFVFQYQTIQQLKELNKQKQYYLDEIKKNDNDLLHLQTDPVYLERFAREKYLMKANNEDIFLIIKKNKKTPKLSSK